MYCTKGSDQEAVIQDHLQGKETQKAFQTAEKRREAKSREKRKDTSIWMYSSKKARRDKKAFLSDQWKEVEENNRLGKTRDLLKKTGDIKGTFQASIKDISSTIRDRSCKDLTEAEEIQKKWQEYTEEQYHKGLNLTVLLGTL